MATKIEWAEESWNPVTGCTPISEGCVHCYAKRMAQRLKGRYGYPEDEPFKVTVHPDRLDQPLKWKKSRMIFVCSMGDLFHSAVLFDWLFKILCVIENSPEHIFLILTKRPAHMLVQLEKMLHYWDKADQQIFPNLWLGVTAENQQRADERIPILLQIPAAKRFVSIEPMLGPVDISSALPIETIGGVEMETWLDWVILGGESGPGARPLHPDWARSVRDQCQAAGVPFFFKQHSAADKIIYHFRRRLLDGREWNERPIGKLSEQPLESRAQHGQPKQE